jgi:hypothetical protein
LLLGRPCTVNFDSGNVRACGSNETVEEEAEEIEAVIPLEEPIENFWHVCAPLEGFAVSIRQPAIDMPLLKRLGEPNFSPEPGLQSVLVAAYKGRSQKAIQTAFKDINETS